MKKKIQLAASKESFEDIRSALNDKKLKNVRNYQSQRISQFIAWYKYNSHMVSLSGNIKAQIRDNHDLFLLELCEVSEAYSLVTVDKDLLTLKKYNQTQIVQPGEFMKQYLQS